ncbi:MAG: hypothetical protein KAI66_19565 [Lentisphaeria bacterium]|nr:hypothetical protein [Lentisphaeria bacterium]
MPDNDFWKAMEWRRPEFVPVRISILPAAWIRHREALLEITSRHPILFGVNAGAERDYDYVEARHAEGGYTDAWGCVWDNVHQGMAAIVTGHPVPRREDVRTLRMPEEDIGFPHGFMFLRLTDLRGFEEMMIDFAEEPPELKQLLDVVLQYNLRQARIHFESLPDTPTLVYFGDDLGLQNALPISPEAWRKHLKPCFAAIYKPFVQAGHSIYMHTDGHILEIIPDLMDCGVRVVNPQVRANGLENLAAVAKGKVCIDLDLDRQLFPFCDTEGIHEHIREAVDVLGSPDGGLWLKAEIGPDVPLANVEAICSGLEEARVAFA